jgi:Ca2+-binding RTX toxin-like protein
LGVSKFLNEEIFGSNFKLISLMAALTAAMLYTLSYQTGWAAVINCPNTTPECIGTSGDDVIIGSSSQPYNSIQGLGGNDYIQGRSIDANWLFGGDGNDILIGDQGRDYMEGGRGNDKYDGWYGDDTIIETTSFNGIQGTLINNDDVISGGEGDDFIISGEGFDRISGGPGADSISASNYNWRDFSADIVNCGEGIYDWVYAFHSADGETATNCEHVVDYDR